LFGQRRNAESIIEIVDECASELDNLRNPDLDKNLAKTLLTNLLGELPQMVDIVGLDMDNVLPVVEQQFIDYAIHMRGTPDLILEDSRKQKAIVIDWKTGKDTPTWHESSQVIAYALMEGRRLGFEKAEAIKAILGEPVRDTKGMVTTISGIRILPVIIRPTTKRSMLKPHPILSATSQDFDIKYNEFKDLLNDTCIEAEHLSLLLTDQHALTGVKEEETQIPMMIQGQEHRVNILRYTPRQLRRGVPSVQQRFPCRLPTGQEFCNLIEPCRYYFGKFGEQGDYEKAMWTLRFKVFKRNEKDLLLYRAIFDVFEFFDKDEIIAKLQSGQGIRARIGHAPTFDPKLKMRLAAIRDDYEAEFRMDLLDTLEVDKSWRAGLIGKRQYRDFEKESRKFRVVNEGKPVLLTSLDSGAPLLSVGVFARVDEISPEENQLTYSFKAPSKILNYQTMIFHEYLKLNPGFGNNVLMVEANVDLTQMELGAIDALQRSLRQTKDDGSTEIAEEELRMEEILAEETAVEIGAESEEKNLEAKLRDMIGKGVKRPVQSKRAN